jgi:hypothetical protein
VVCDDKDECTRDTCAPATGECLFEPLSFDLDKDGHKGPAPGHKAGDPGSCGDDCDDTSAAAYPGAKEICDGVDNDCNGIVDDKAKFTPVAAEPALVSEASLAKAYTGGIAYGGDKQGYLAAYTGENAQNTGVYLRALSAAGTPAATTSQVNLTSGDAQGGPMVWTGDRYGIAWSDRRDSDYEIYFNTFGPDGSKLGPDVRITEAPGFSVNPTLGWNGSSFYIAWEDNRSGQFQILAQKVSLDAKPQGTEQLLASEFQASESPSIAASSIGIGIAWRAGDGLGSTVYFRAYDADLQPLGDTNQIATGANYIDPAVVFNKTSFVVTYGEKLPFRVFGAALSLQGATQLPPQQLSPQGTPGRRAIPIALGDRLIVVYSTQAADGYNLFSRTFSSALVPLSDAQQLTTAPGDDLANNVTFGPNGDVGVYFDGRLSDAGKLKNAAFFTRLECTAGQ